MSKARRRVPGVLLIHHRPARDQFIDADNVAENIAAFGRYSRYTVYGVNTDLGFPERLANLSFDAIVVHYSVFARTERASDLDYQLRGGFFEYLAEAEGYKVATFQDEYHWCRKRFDFLNTYGFDCVYTLLEPPFAEQVYGERTKVSKVVTNLPGYVSPEIIESGHRFAKPDATRSIDVGYRGSRLLPYLGRASREKTEIGERFLAADGGLVLDIGLSEADRLYGQAWSEFVGNCRGALGVESGVSCFDLEDEVLAEYLRLSPNGEEVSVEELEAGALSRWDEKIPYRTISPRHLEAAALRACQILLEGRYSGVMEPMRHYIPLKKDYSNLDEVIEIFRDPGTRQELTDNAYEDLIASGTYSYERFVGEFDQTLLGVGLNPGRRATRRRSVERALRETTLTQRVLRKLGARWEWLHMAHPRIWRVLHVLTRPLVVPMRALGRALGGG